MVQLTRRHRFTVLTLALVAGGVFFVFIARVHLTSPPLEPPRECGASSLYAEKSFAQARDLYHFTLEQLIEERMRLYEGTTPLMCEGETMTEVIPAGQSGSLIAALLQKEHPDIRIADPFTYAEFERLLYELWRTYDCRLIAASPGGSDDVERERIHAGRTFDRLLWTLRSSEQYLPLHASLRCLQRAGTDVRNAMAILSDASQCLPARLAWPETSLLK